METQAVRISEEENNSIDLLFSTYTAYMSMLEHLSNNESAANTPVYERKWDEAVAIWIQLDKEKKAVEKKYKPEGEWERFEFDFDNQQVIFSRGT